MQRPNYYNIIGNIRTGEVKVNRDGGFDCSSVSYQHLELAGVLEFLKLKLQPYYLHFTRGSEFLSFRAPKRGTETYQSWYLNRRFKEVRRAVKKLTSVNYLTADSGLTNSLLITFTYSCSVEDSWKQAKEFSSVLTAIKRKLERKGFAVVYFVRVLEAQRTGKAHIHLLVVLNSAIEFRFDFVKGRGFIKKQGVYETLKRALESCWKFGFVDLQPISSKAEAVSYLTKYILKEGGEVESLLQRDPESLRESEVKRLLLYYYLFKYQLRLFSVSRTNKRLDNSTNNNCVIKWQRVRSERLLEAWNLLTATVLIGNNYLVNAESWSKFGIVAVRGSPTGVKLTKRRQKLEILDWREFPVRGKLLSLMQFEDIKLNSKLGFKVGMGSNFQTFRLWYQ